MTRISIGGLGMVLALAYGCALPWDAPEDVGVDEHHVTNTMGNAAALPGNASALPGNASALPGNAGALPGNAGALPGNAGEIAVADASAWMVRPRASAVSTCGTYKLSQWEHASSYRCNGNGRIHSSDLRVWPFSGTSASGVNLGAAACTRCGVTTPRRVYLPATLSNVTGTSVSDVVLEIDFAGPSEYDCTKSEYAVMVYKMRVSRDDCLTFSNPDLVTTVPAPQRLFSTSGSMVPAGNGWGLIVPATVTSAVFKASHYTKAALTFYPERSDAWKFGYPTTSSSCAAQPASCLSGASMLLSYSLALANVAPVELAGNVYAVPGTVTGVPTWISVVTASGGLNLPYVEVGTASVSNDYLKPGTREQSASPYAYDAAFAPGSHYYAGPRSAFGSSSIRIDLARKKFCANSITACVDPTLQTALITNYVAGVLSSPTAGVRIADAYRLLGKSSPFVVTAMPEPGAVASCTTPIDSKKKQVVDSAFGPGFCIPTPPPPTAGSGTGTGTGTGTGS